MFQVAKQKQAMSDREVTKEDASCKKTSAGYCTSIFLIDCSALQVPIFTGMQPDNNLFALNGISYQFLQADSGRIALCSISSWISVDEEISW